MSILILYYLFVFIFMGIGATLSIICDCDIWRQGVFKTVFMYQYAVYELTKDHINMAGIVILEILTTFSVWFLNATILAVICIWYVFSVVWDTFYFIFKKR